LAGITYDLASTILRPPDADEVLQERTSTWSLILRDFGHEADEAMVLNAFRDALVELVVAWTAGRQFTAVETTTFCLRQLECTVTPAVRAQLVDVTEQAGIESAHLTPNIVETLTVLRESGLRIGIISDTFVTPGSVWWRRLEHLGVAEYVHHCSWSDAVGAYKPSAAIFDHALRGLALNDPARVAHVGDLRRTDVAGARNAGWRSVRYAGVYGDESDLPDADYLIKDHLELLHIFDLAPKGTRT
jgi:HAD superfamily hydrolase (TIGR01549 family)